MLRPWLAFLTTRAALFALLALGADGCVVLGRSFHPGGPNLRIYAYFAAAAARGANPYTLSAGAVPASSADYPPLLMLLFGGLAKLISARLGVLCACFAGELALFAAVTAVAAQREPRDRLATQLLLIANPYWIATELYVVQYKTWIAAGLVGLAVLDSPIIVGLLSGAFVLPALLVPLRLRVDRDLKAAALAVAIAAACWLPYFPEAWVLGGVRRANRYAVSAVGDSLLALVSGVAEPALLIALALTAVALLVRRGPVILRAAAAMALISALSPESVMNRLLPFALTVMLLARMPASSRLACLGLCWVGELAYYLRWAPEHYERSAIPLWIGCLMHLPVAVSVVIAWRAAEPVSAAAPR